MKINGFNGPNDVYKAYNQNKPDKNNQPVKEKTDQADSLQLSKEAQFKKEIEATLKELPEVREGLVNRLKKQIQTGTYNADAKKIADGIMQERLLDKRI